jgi:hypothetical protein
MQVQESFLETNDSATAPSGNYFVTRVNIQLQNLVDLQGLIMRPTPIAASVESTKAVYITTLIQ